MVVNEDAKEFSFGNLLNEAPLGVFGIQDIRGKNYRNTGYLRKKVIGIQDIEK